MFGTGRLPRINIKRIFDVTFALDAALMSLSSSAIEKLVFGALSIFLSLISFNQLQFWDLQTLFQLPCRGGRK